MEIEGPRHKAGFQGYYETTRQEMKNRATESTGKREEGVTGWSDRPVEIPGLEMMTERWTKKVEEEGPGGRRDPLVTIASQQLQILSGDEEHAVKYESAHVHLSMNSSTGSCAFQLNMQLRKRIHSRNKPSAD